MTDCLFRFGHISFRLETEYIAFFFFFRLGDDHGSLLVITGHA